MIENQDKDGRVAFCQIVLRDQHRPHLRAGENVKRGAQFFFYQLLSGRAIRDYTQLNGVRMQRCKPALPLFIHF